MPARNGSSAYRMIAPAVVLINVAMPNESSGIRVHVEQQVGAAHLRHRHIMHLSQGHRLVAVRDDVRWKARCGIVDSAAALASVELKRAIRAPLVERQDAGRRGYVAPCMC